MEITKSNFTEKLDEIAEAISQASFLAIDGEFTGLDKPGYSHISAFDTPEERYMNLREGSLDFLLVQVGLCTFKYQPETQSYEARPYNFYVFPRPYTRQAPDRRFLCQSSSIDFLVQQGFDFNKLFREGIPYLTHTEEQDLRKGLELKHQAFSKMSSPGATTPEGGEGPGKGPVQIPEEQKGFVAKTCDQISKFMDTAEEEVLQLEPCNAFQRKLIYQTVRSKFSSVHLDTKTGEKKERFIVVTKVASEEDLKQKEKDKQNAEFMELEEAVGFTKVMKLISESGKLVVGHNMVLDVMHLLNQFFMPLPQTLEDFKGMVRCCLPRLIDTKFIASSHPFRDLIPNTVLGLLQQTLENEPFTPAKVALPEEFCNYKDATEKFHEAGYDAYVTGSIFATLANFLGQKEGHAKPVVEASSSLLDPFLNKLHLMRINDIPFLNLAGEDVQPNRDHVFHLSFPNEWKSSDINNLFGPYGNIFISWINETSAYVSLYKKDNAGAVLKALGETKKLYRLVPYKVFKGSSAAVSVDRPPAISPGPGLLPSPAPVTTPTPRAGKRSAASVNGEGQKGDSEPVGKKYCTADTADSSRVASIMDSEEIPKVVPRSQASSKAASTEAAEADSTEMFAVPKDW